MSIVDLSTATSFTPSSSPTAAIPPHGGQIAIPPSIRSAQISSCPLLSTDHYSSRLHTLPKLLDITSIKVFEQRRWTLQKDRCRSSGKAMIVMCDRRESYKAWVQSSYYPPATALPTQKLDAILAMNPMFQVSTRNSMLCQCTDDGQRLEPVYSSGRPKVKSCTRQSCRQVQRG